MKLFVLAALITFIVVAVIAFLVPHTSTQHLIGGLAIGGALMSAAKLVDGISFPTFGHTVVTTTP